VAWPYLVLYVAVGLAAALLVQILGSLPAALITTIVGLALFSPLMGSVVAMLKEVRDIESSLITFLVTASGVTFYGVGSAFWGLVAGLVLFGARHLVKR
jgi:benzoate membrane transport protein